MILKMDPTVDYVFKRIFGREVNVTCSIAVINAVLQEPPGRQFTKPLQEVRTPLERWMYFLCHGAELDPDDLPPELDDPAIRHALGEMQMMTQSELERERYEARLKWQRDHAAAVDDARREARREGEATTLVQQVQTYQELLDRPISPGDQLQQLSLEELRTLTGTLKEEVTASLRKNREDA